MKRSLRRGLCLIFVILMIPLFSLTARAADYSAVLNSLDFTITLMEDGSAFIVETREVVFTGDHEFSRYRVNNQFAGPRVFYGWNVWIDGISAPQLDEPDNDNRPENTFVVEDGDGENTVSVYFRQQGSGTRVFQISYWVENAIKLYSDVGVFSWNLTGENSISDIGTLTATLLVPDGVPAEDFRIWAHGPQNGNFDKQPDGSAALLVDNVPVGTIVDIRATLPADFLCGGWEQEGEALPGILEKEQELADRANAKREEEKRQQEEAERAQAEQEAYWAERRSRREEWEEKHPILYFIQELCDDICFSVEDFLDENGGKVLAFFLFLPFIGIVIIVMTLGKVQNIRRSHNQKKFRSSPTQSPQYYRNLPDDRPAPVVDRLVHFYDGKFSVSRQLCAALLELNLKNLIHFRTTAGDVTILLNKPQGGELFPADVALEAAEPVRDDQKILWDFLVKAAGGNGLISMKDLQKYIKDNPKTALDFRHSFGSAVEKEFTETVNSKDVERYSSGGRKRRLIVSVAAGVLAMLVRMFSTLYYGIEFGESLLVGLIAFVVAVVIQGIFRFVKKIVEIPSYVLDQQGEDDLALWQAFGRFLDDFTTFGQKELPEFSAWREYMVYAVAVGRGQKVAQALALKYPEALSTGTDTVDDDMYRWLQDMALYDAMDSIGREVTEARAPSSSGSSSNDSSNDFEWSDPSGGGGGFSDSDGGSDSGSGGDFID